MGALIPLNAPVRGQTAIPKDRFRWSVWALGLSGEALVRFVQDEVFAFFEEIATRSATDFIAATPQYYGADGSDSGGDVGRRAEARP